MSRVATDAEMLADLVPLAGLRVVDVGSGTGAMVRAIRAAGAASVTGIECTPGQLQAAHAADPDHAGDHLEGVGQNLPLPDASADLVTFFYSLHHVPAEHMPAALAEAHRVLVPGGLLYVAEPMTEGSGFQVGRLIDDETEVRGHAQAALDALPAGLFAETGRHTYTATAIYPDADTLMAQAVRISPDRAQVVRANRAAIEAAFAAHGARTEDGVRFTYPILVRQFTRI